MNSGNHPGQFTLIGTHNIPLQQTSILVGSTKRIRLVGAKVKSFDEIKIVSTNAAVVTGRLHKAPFDGPNGIWTVELKCMARGNARILAKFLGVVVATIDIEAVKLNAVGVSKLHSETGFVV